MEKVEATVAFSNAQIGSKAVGEQFYYDLGKDPLGLKAEGKIVKVKAESAEKSGK